MLPKEQAILQLEAFNKAIQTARYQTGALVDLTGIPGNIEQILVGDLHAKAYNLERILEHDNNIEKIKNGKAILLILGDAVHREDDLHEMDSSINIMQDIMDLKIMSPDNVYYLLGNHDYLSKNCERNFVYQGDLLRKRMEELYGRGYTARYRTFIEHSPIVAIGRGFVALHGGPPTQSLTIPEIIELPIKEEFNEIVNELLWNRYPNLYNSDDVTRFLKNIGQKGATLLVSHSPKDKEDWHWEIDKNHHIIFAANSKFGYAVVRNGATEFIEI